MGGRGAQYYGGQTPWQQRQIPYQHRGEMKELEYNIIRSSELHAGADHAFFSDVTGNFSIVTYDATKSIESLDLEQGDTFDSKPAIRWISDGQINDVYLDDMTIEEFSKKTEVFLSMPKGGYVASKRMSRVFRDYRVQMFLPDNSLNIVYLPRDDTRDAIWDGAGLINREVLKKMQLGPLEEAIEELEAKVEREYIYQEQETRTENEIKLEKVRARHQKLSRELETCNRIEYTIMTEKGQDKGHAIVCDNLVGDDGKTPVDFILLDSDTKPETKLEGREWLGINFVHGHDHMRLDAQSLIHMQEFFRPEFLADCVEQEGELFMKALEGGSVSEAMRKIDKNKTAEEIKSWALNEFLQRGGPIGMSRHLSNMLISQHVKRIAQKTSVDKINIPIPGGRYYMIPDAVGQRGGVDIEVPRGEVSIDERYGTAWVNQEDWLELQDSPSGQGLAGIWGGADNDDALWTYPFEDYDGERKVLAWRSPNLLGEYVILKPMAGNPDLEFDTVDGSVSWPKADSRKLPPRIDHMPSIESKITPESAGSVGAGQDYSVEAMAPAVERAKQNAGAVGLFCNGLMVEAGLHNGRPEDLPAALDHVIDAAVKTGADLTLVKEWCIEHTKQILRQGVPIPKLLKRRLAHDRNRDPNELIPPIIRTPKDSQHFLDRIDRHVTGHIESIRERQKAITYELPVRLMEVVFNEDRQKYGNEMLRAGAKLNQKYTYTQKKIRDRKKWGREDKEKLSQQITTEIDEMNEETKHQQLRQFIYEDVFTAQARAKRRSHPYVPGQANDPALLTEEDHDTIIANTNRELEHLIKNNQVDRVLHKHSLKKKLWFSEKKKKEWTDQDYDEVRREMMYEMSKYHPDDQKALVRAAMVSANMNDDAASDGAVWVPGFDTPDGRSQGIADITMAALTEIGILDEIKETKDGVIVYPKATPPKTYSSVGIKNAWFNWYQSYARQNGLTCPTGTSHDALAQAGTSRKEIMAAFKDAAFDYQDQQITIKEKINETTKQQQLIAYTPDGYELGEITDPSQVARGMDVKIQFAFPRSGTLQVAFDKDALQDIIF